MQTITLHCITVEFRSLCYFPIDKDQLTRWFCPICNEFDPDGITDEEEVKNHIVKNHITPVLDLKHDLFKIKVSDEKDNFNESDRFRCDKCFALLKDDQELNYHLAYEHKLIHEESKKLKTDVMDYYPMPFSRLGKELRWMWFFFFNRSTILWYFLSFQMEMSPMRFHLFRYKTTSFEPFGTWTLQRISSQHRVPYGAICQ